METFRVRLVFAVISTILEETAIVVIYTWGLPRIDLNLPFWPLPLIMLAWLWYSVYTFRKGTAALNQEQITGLTHMTGSSGRVMTQLKPEGLVKIRGELWVARSIKGHIKTGRRIRVVGRERLKLLVDEEETETGQSAEKPPSSRR